MHEVSDMAKGTHAHAPSVAERERERPHTWYNMQTSNLNCPVDGVREERGRGLAE